MEEEKIKEITKEIRSTIIEMIYKSGSGHPGGSLSCTDILTVLYFNQMNINEKNPRDSQRDRLVLSKGHCAPALYAVLQKRGFFPKEELDTLRKMGSKLQGHPDMNRLVGVDFSSGSLGQGLSIANGMALNSKMNHDGYRVYCILGDGELEEGQIWEAAQTSNKYNLDNLCVIVDYNKLQLSGSIKDVKQLDNIQGKFESFGFNTIVVDGHNISKLIDAFNTAKLNKGKPTCIIAKTVKGKGVSFMENNVDWHGKAPNEEELKQALKELK